MVTSPAAMDELSFSCSSSTLAIIVATILPLSLLVRRALSTKETRARLPPGPWNLPVLGSLHHLLGAPPHRALLRLSRRHGPLMLLRLGEVLTFVVSSPEAAMEVMKTKDPAFASRPRSPTVDVVGRGLVFAPYGAYWQQMRKVCVAELLGARHVRRMEGIRQAELSRLVESVAGSGSASAAVVVNLSEGLAVLTNNVIARAVFGAECRQRQAFLRELDVVATLAGVFSLPDLYPSSRLVRWLSRGDMRALRRSYARLQRIVDGVIQDRIKTRRGTFAVDGAGADDVQVQDEGLLDVLLRLQVEGSLAFPLTAETICAVVSDIFGSATDTTATTLEWAMAELIRNPPAMSRATHEIREKLGQQGRGRITSADLGGLRYLRMVIKETLRLHPAAALILRASQQDCQIMGYDVPKGAPVITNAFAIARDPRHWDKADEFRPERFEVEGGAPDGDGDEYRWTTHFEFIPFGAGRRQCPGALFATTTMELALASLLYHFDWALPGGADPEALDMSEVFGITMRRRSNLRALASLPLM